MNELKQAISRRSALRKGTTIGAFVVAGTAASGSAVAQDTEGKATGDVTYGNFDTEFSFNAHGTSHPNGPRGSVDVSNHRQNQNTADFTGSVNCYEQDENTAYFGGPINSIEPEDATPNEWYYASVLDGGTPGTDGDLVRVIRYNEEQDCDEAGDPIREVTEGNLQVHEPKGRQS